MEAEGSPPLARDALNCCCCAAVLGFDHADACGAVLGAEEVDEDADEGAAGGATDGDATGGCWRTLATAAGAELAFTKLESGTLLAGADDDDSE